MLNYSKDPDFDLSKTMTIRMSTFGLEKIAEVQEHNGYTLSETVRYLIDTGLDQWHFTPAIDEYLDKLSEEDCIGFELTAAEMGLSFPELLRKAVTAYQLEQSSK